MVGSSDTATATANHPIMRQARREPQSWLLNGRAGSSARAVLA